MIRRHFLPDAAAMSLSQVKVKPCLEDLGLVRDFIEEHAVAAGLSSDLAGELLLAVDEAVSNIVMHGMPPPESSIDVLADLEADALTVRIRDSGPLFDPTHTTDPHLEISPLERERAGGYGLYLLNNLVDRIAYRVTEDGRNELSLVKRRD